MRLPPRLRAVAVVCATLALGTVSGCSGSGGPSSPGAAGNQSASASPGAHPSDSAPSSQPSEAQPSGPPVAAMAGGACLLLDFHVINAALGSSFNVAAAAASSDTYTCDVQASAAAYPDLTLTVTATDLLPLDFTSSVVPSGSSSVTKLGKIGYVLQVAATTKLGPAIEVGWLSGNGRLIIMRYTFPKSATAADATSLKTKMIALARVVDGTTV